MDIPGSVGGATPSSTFPPFTKSCNIFVPFGRFCNVFIYNSINSPIVCTQWRPGRGSGICGHPAKRCEGEPEKGKERLGL